MVCNVIFFLDFLTFRRRKKRRKNKKISVKRADFKNSETKIERFGTKLFLTWSSDIDENLLYFHFQTKIEKTG
jgi:hypothetical protein